MSGTYVFNVVAEAEADRTVATSLADRVAVEVVEWLDGKLDTTRSWTGVEPATAYTKWTRVKQLGAEYHHGLHIHAWGRGAARNEAEKAIHLCLLFGDRNGKRPDCIVLVRDSDGVRSRVSAFQQAASGMSVPVVVVAMPHPKREAWVLAGFDPKNEQERKALQGLRKELGFNPTAEAHRLTAAKRGAPKDAKRVLDKLMQGDKDREAECWAVTPLATLEKRGVDSGLRSFLCDVRTKMVPLFK